MSKLLQFTCLVLILTAVLVASSQDAAAGRVGGPMSMVTTVPAFQSQFFDIPFAANDPAVVSISGEGKAIVYLMLYDGDGHVAMGSGDFDRRTASLDVYRSGTFRVELRNTSSFASTVVLSTN